MMIKKLLGIGLVGLVSIGLERFSFRPYLLRKVLKKRTEAVLNHYEVFNKRLTSVLAGELSEEVRKDLRAQQILLEDEVRLYASCYMNALKAIAEDRNHYDHVGLYVQYEKDIQQRIRDLGKYTHVKGWDAE